MKKILQTLFTLLIVLTTYSSQAQIRLVAVDPGTGIITLQNFGSSNVDVSGYRFCHQFNYTNTVASMTPFSGDPANFAPGLLVLTGAVGLNVSTSDLGLYLPTGAFTDPNAMVDFVQWGSGGNGRESVAVAKGIWTAGDFITGAGPYTYSGNGTTDVGLPFWQAPTTVKENEASNAIKVYPNPTTNLITIDVSDIKVSTIKVVSIIGKTVLARNTVSSQNKITLDLSSLPVGNYTIILNTSEGMISKKISVAK